MLDFRILLGAFFQLSKFPLTFNLLRLLSVDTEFYQKNFACIVIIAWFISHILYYNDIYWLLFKCCTKLALWDKYHLIILNLICWHVKHFNLSSSYCFDGFLIVFGFYQLIMVILDVLYSSFLLSFLCLRLMSSAHFRKSLTIICIVYPFLSFLLKL